MKRWQERRRGAPDSAEMASVLECACKDHTRAVVLVRDTGEVLRGRFERLEHARVTLALDPSSPAAQPRPLSVCCVSFAHDERAYVFLAPLWRVLVDPSQPGIRLLSVGFPGQIASLDVGSARRIPIGVGVTLSIELGSYDRRSWAPEAVDLSASGVLLEFGTEKPPSLPVGALMEIVLELEGVRAALTAAVRRVEGHRLALSFVEATPGSTAAVPEELTTILAQLEQRWLEADDR
jgi:hypothetical protein